MWYLAGIIAQGLFSGERSQRTGSRRDSTPYATRCATIADGARSRVSGRARGIPVDPITFIWEVLQQVFGLIAAVALPVIILVLIARRSRKDGS